MTTKQVSVRLSAVGGQQVRAELEGVGEAGARGFGRLSREMEVANQRMARFWRRTNLGLAALAATIKTTGALMIRSGLQVVDAQTKLAASLNTTVASIQVLERAGDLAGVSMGQIEQATMQLTRRLCEHGLARGRHQGQKRASSRLAVTDTDGFAPPVDVLDPQIAPDRRP